MSTAMLRDADRPFVATATDPKDLAEFLAARLVADGRRMQGLVAAGRVVPVRAGSEVAVRDDGRVVYRDQILWADPATISSN